MTCCKCFWHSRRGGGSSHICLYILMNSGICNIPRIIGIYFNSRNHGSVCWFNSSNLNEWRKQRSHCTYKSKENDITLAWVLLISGLTAYASLASIKPFKSKSISFISVVLRYYPSNTFFLFPNLFHFHVYQLLTYSRTSCLM